MERLLIVDTLRGEGRAMRDTPWGPVAIEFGNWEAEYRAFRRSAGVFRPPSFGLVEITGSQRAEFLNRLTTNKLDPIQPGEGRETFLTPSPTAGSCIMYSSTPGQSRWCYTRPPVRYPVFAHTWITTGSAKT